MPTNTTEVPPASSNPFAWPGSQAGSAQLDSASTWPEPQAVQFPNAPGSPISSISGSMFPEDINTSGSWNLIDPRCDAEVADITGEQNQKPVNQPMNTSYDSTQANPNQGLPQANQASLNQHPGTLYSVQLGLVMDICEILLVALLVIFTVVPLGVIMFTVEVVYRRRLKRQRNRIGSRRILNHVGLSML